MNVSFEVANNPWEVAPYNLLPQPEPITMRILLDDAIMKALDYCGYNREKVIKYMGMFRIARTFQQHGWTDTYYCGKIGLFDISTVVAWDGLRCWFDDYIHFLPGAEENKEDDKW